MSFFTHELVSAESSHILDHSPAASPALIMSEIRASESVWRLTKTTRRQVESILAQKDDRFLVIIKSHSAQGSADMLALCHRVQRLSQKLSNDILMVLQVNPGNARAAVNGSPSSPRNTSQSVGCKTNEEVRAYRELLSNVTAGGIPIAAEVRDNVLVHHISNLLSIGIAASRDVESLSLRELVSGLLFPFGLKDGCGVPVDAIRSSAEQHQFFGMTKLGQLAFTLTAGNPNAFAILPGEPNFVDQALPQFRDVQKGLRHTVDWHPVVIDCYSGTFARTPGNAVVKAQLAALLEKGESSLTGIIVEADIAGERGNSDFGTGWASVKATVEELSACIRARRAMLESCKDAGHS